jgi:hypothetical protein
MGGCLVKFLQVASKRKVSVLSIVWHDFTGWPNNIAFLEKDADRVVNSRGGSGGTVDEMAAEV